MGIFCTEENRSCGELQKKFQISIETDPFGLNELTKQTFLEKNGTLGKTRYPYMHHWPCNLFSVLTEDAIKHKASALLSLTDPIRKNHSIRIKNK